ncbi:MAG TPA: hypothetical protein VEL47_05875, partial [Myxococcota bacterium]|nr:hypothetical protein [Myxococcota bacterium]
MNLVRYLNVVFFVFFLAGVSSSSFAGDQSYHWTNDWTLRDPKGPTKVLERTRPKNEKEFPC